MEINNAMLEEAISLTEALVSKSNISGDKANTKILISPDITSGEAILIITVQDTIMFKVPLKNQGIFLYGAGSGIHLNGFDIYDARVVKELSMKYKYYTDIMYQKLPLIEEKELRNNEDFERLLGLKSDQGLKFYQIPDYDHPGETYMIPMFAGFLSLNKSDTISVKIYDLDEVNHLINFSIYKKKINRTIEMYCRVLKI